MAKGLDPRIIAIEELIHEAMDCPDEISPAKVALEIHAKYREDIEIANNIRSFWIESASGAER